MSDTEEKILNELIEFSKNYSRGFPLTHFIEQFKASKSKKDYEIFERFKYYECAIDGDLSAIKSVRRLSDGLTLSIDDVVYVEFDGGKGFSDTIHHFTKCNDIIDVYFCNNLQTAYVLNYLNIKKTKYPLFITEDGKPIYEGDEYWFIRYDDTIGTANSLRPPFPKGKATFSTIEAANEYTLQNKNLFSIVDICKLFDANEPELSYNEIINRATKLAQEKINSK